MGQEKQIPFGMTTKGAKGQRQRKKQIPCGDDNQKTGHNQIQDITKNRTQPKRQRREPKWQIL
jgi:hypothetical protein